MLISSICLGADRSDEHMVREVLQKFLERPFGIALVDRVLYEIMDQDKSFVQVHSHGILFGKQPLDKCMSSRLLSGNEHY